jgi:proteasome lid subunit RPN8/RPN11
VTALHLTPGERARILRHARRATPRECCGLLAGRGDRVVFTTPTRNVARGRSRYRIDPAAHIALRRILRAFVPPMTIVGAYHSHPRGDARPSPRDVAEAAYPEWIHLIVGLRGGRTTLAAFEIAGGQVREVPIVFDGPGGV